MNNSSPITVQVPEPNIKTLKLKLVGTSPLIMNQFSAKAKKQILDKQLKKANVARKKREPKKEFEGSLYLIKKGTFKYANGEFSTQPVKHSGVIGLPALWIKQATVSAARNIDGLHMTLLRGAIFVQGRPEDGLIPIKYKELLMREDVVRLQRGSADLRYRGQLNGWEADIEVKFNADLLSPEQVINLIKISGYSVGAGEWRPQKSGDFGCYTVEPTKAK